MNFWNFFSKLFSNKDKRYKIPQYEGFEPQLKRLFRACTGREDIPDVEEVEYENDTFAVRRYWWGGCTCGAAFPQHAPDCKVMTEDLEPFLFQLGQTKILPISVLADKNYAFSLLLDENYPVSMCTCGVLDNWTAKDEHAPDCKLVAPNFLYKPTGLEIRWGQYPLRKAHANRPITLRQFADIMTKCIESIKE